MSDITHCPGGDCPDRNRCYRFRALAYGRFDAFGTPPWDPTTRRCEQLWDISLLEPTEDDVRTRAHARWVAAGRPAGTADADWHAARAELLALTASRLRDEEPSP